MEQEKNRRPTQRGGTAATRERPQRPNRPRPPRPQTGTAADREARRRTRQAEGGEEPRRTAPRPRTRTQDRERPRHTEAPKAEPRPAPKRKKKKPHRVYNTNFGFKFVTMLAVVAVIVLSMIIFFKVKHIQVILQGPGGVPRSAGAEVLSGSPEDLLPTAEGGQAQPYYTAQEIIDASGINLDDNLLSLSKATVASRIHAALPYVNEIQVKKQLPGTVILTVSEFDVTYGIQDETGAWWLMSREGRILEPASEQAVKGHLTVTGMPIEVPAVGDYFKPAATEGADLSEIAAKRSAALAVLPALEGKTFAKEILIVDVGTSYDIILWYGTQYEIRLGNTENLEYKLQYLQGVLDQLGRDKSGTIDLTFNEDNGAHFLPFG